MGKIAGEKAGRGKGRLLGRLLGGQEGTLKKGTYFWRDILQSYRVIAKCNCGIIDVFYWQILLAEYPLVMGSRDIFYQFQNITPKNEFGNFPEV